MSRRPRFIQTACKIEWWVVKVLGNGSHVFSKAPKQYDGRRPTASKPLLHKGRKP